MHVRIFSDRKISSDMHSMNTWSGLEPVNTCYGTHARPVKEYLYTNYRRRARFFRFGDESDESSDISSSEDSEESDDDTGSRYRTLRPLLLV